MKLYQQLFGEFRAPAGEGNDAGGGAVDRGDDFLADEGDKKVEADADVDGKKAEPEDKKADEADDKKADDAKDEEGKKKERFVPESRHTEMTRKYKDRIERYEARIKELEESRQNGATTDEITKAEEAVDKMEDELDAARADNNPDKVRAIRARIRAATSKLVDMKASERAAQAKNEAIEEIRYEVAITKAEADFPILNPDSDDFNSDVAEEVLDLRNSLMKNGVTAAKALSRAVKYVLGDANKTEAGPKDRERSARERAAEDNKKQPPALAKIGLDSDKAGRPQKGVDITKMTQKQFAKFSEENLKELERIRGDEFVGT